MRPNDKLTISCFTGTVHLNEESSDSCESTTNQTLVNDPTIWQPCQGSVLQVYKSVAWHPLTRVNPNNITPCIANECPQNCLQTMLCKDATLPTMMKLPGWNK